MAEKSGIQMIEELLGSMAVFDRRLQVVEHLLKQLLSVANSSVCPIPETKPIEIKPVETKPIRFQGPTIEKAKNPGPNLNARVVGKIMEKGRPVGEVNITVYDDSNNAVKKTRTNRAGEWMAQLPPGKYAAECTLEGRISGNVSFNVGQEDRIVRVGQPT